MLDFAHVEVSTRELDVMSRAQFMNAKRSELFGECTEVLNRSGRQ